MTQRFIAALTLAIPAALGFILGSVDPTRHHMWTSIGAFLTGGAVALLLCGPAALERYRSGIALLLNRR